MESKRKEKTKLQKVVDGCVDDLIFTFGISKDKAQKELVNAFQEPLIKNRILSFVLLGNETTTAAGTNCSGVTNRLCQ